MAFKPKDALTTNHWYFEIAGLVSPHFHTLEGIEKKSGEVIVVDGRTNTKHKFSSQIKEFGDITLTRTRDNSIDDRAMNALAADSMDNGRRFDGHMIKLHNGREAFRIMFEGLRIKNIAHPSYKTNSEDALDMRYSISVSGWEEVF